MPKRHKKRRFDIYEQIHSCFDAKISEKSELTKKDSEKALAAFIETVSETLAKKDKVQLVGFGTFETRRREARTGRDPRTGNPIKIPASNSPAFKAGKALKEAVN